VGTEHKGVEITTSRVGLSIVPLSRNGNDVDKLSKDARASVTEQYNLF